MYVFFEKFQMCRVGPVAILGVLVISCRLGRAVRDVFVGVAYASRAGLQDRRSNFGSNWGVGTDSSAV